MSWITEHPALAWLALALALAAFEVASIDFVFLMFVVGALAGALAAALGAPFVLQVVVAVVVRCCCSAWCVRSSSAASTWETRR